MVVLRYEHVHTHTHTHTEREKERETERERERESHEAFGEMFYRTFLYKYKLEIVCWCVRLLNINSGTEVLVLSYTSYND